MTERLLISTYNQIILWDGRARVIWDERGGPTYHNFFGITWNEDEIYVAEGGHTGDSIYHVFDEELGHVGLLPLGRPPPTACISDPHQIYWWGGELYITSAHADTLWIWYGGGLEPVRWGEEGEPTLHLNSIWCDGKNLYVVEHRKREMPKRVMVLDLCANPLHRIEIPDGAFVKRKPHGIHNVYIEDGWLYTCSPKALVAWNLDSGVTRTVTSRLIQKAHYIRGLARVPGKWFVGLSEAKVRSERGKGDSAVLVLNDDLEQIDLYPLQDTGGLNDIRAIDGPDIAHNGIECPGGRA